MLSHDDKDCKILLRSKGSLFMENQQFRHWIRAPQYNLSRHKTIEVNGYDPGESQPHLVRSSEAGVHLSQCS